MKSLIVALVPCFVMNAFAAEETIRCRSVDHLTTLEVVVAYPGSLEELVSRNTLPAAAVASKMIVRGSRRAALRAELTGHAANSARGPSYELKGTTSNDRALELMIAAPASGALSELMIGENQKIQLICN